MKRLILIFALLSIPAWAAPAFVQKCPTAGITTAGAGTTAACTFTSNNTVHNFIVIVVAAANCSTCTLSAADTAGNSYSTSISNTPAVGESFYTFYVCDILAGANTVTVTASNSAGAWYIGGAEYSGLATTSCLDKTAQSGRVSGSNNTSGVTATRSQASELLVGWSIAFGGALTVGTNVAWVDRGNTTAGFADADWEEFVASSTGTDAATWTNASGFGQAQISTFKTPAAGGPPLGQFPRIE